MKPRKARTVSRRRVLQGALPAAAAAATLPWSASLAALDAKIRAALMPEPELTVSQWADEHRILDSKSSPEPGPWRTSRTPYLREIMDSLSPSDPTETVVFMKGTQLGATEAGNNWMGYVIHRCPAPMLYVQPTLEQAEAYSKQRLAPMIDLVPVLRSRVPPSRARDGGNTVRLKEFPGGLVRMVGANSPSSLASTPIRFAFLDEIDRYRESAGVEGDPVEIARKRTSNYKRNRKLFLTASPTVKDLSRIEAAYKSSDKRVYLVPCPHCGHRQQITWARIRWDKNEDETEHYPETVRLVCQKCERDIPEHRKTWMLARGEWVATAKGDGKTRGYHLSALYSPLGWYAWEDIVREFLRAKRKGREALKVWTNTALAETWEETTTKPDEGSLLARRERYEHAAPEGVLTITAGVDVQEDRLEVEVVGWGLGEESWSLDYHVFQGQTDRAEVWNRLDELLEQTYEHASGERFYIQAVAVDASYSADVVYRYVEGREARNVWAIKGMGGARPFLSAAQPRRRGRSQRKVHLVIVGVDEAKGILYARLRSREAGPGHCHFPIGDAWGERYFEQLTAERRIMRYHKGFPKPEWVLPPGKRNEALDCRVYAMAALRLLDPVLEVIERNLARRIKHRAAHQETANDERPRPRRRPRGGWMTNWRRGR